ncbi:hypothetical protein M885DRAFT_512152, partial [Pelagophyceae sp. CCMP2097]
MLVLKSRLRAVAERWSSSRPQSWVRLANEPIEKGSFSWVARARGAPGVREGGPSWHETRALSRPCWPARPRGEAERRGPSAGAEPPPPSTQWSTQQSTQWSRGAGRRGGRVAVRSTAAESPPPRAAGASRRVRRQAVSSPSAGHQRASKQRQRPRLVECRCLQRPRARRGGRGASSCLCVVASGVDWRAGHGRAGAANVRQCDHAFPRHRRGPRLRDDRHRGGLGPPLVVHRLFHLENCAVSGGRASFSSIRRILLTNRCLASWNSASAACFHAWTACSYCSMRLGSHLWTSRIDVRARRSLGAMEHGCTRSEGGAFGARGT